MNIMRSVGGFAVLVAGAVAINAGCGSEVSTPSSGSASVGAGGAGGASSTTAETTGTSTSGVGGGDAGGGKILCNPVTGEPCASISPSSPCHVDADGVFACIKTDASKLACDWCVLDSEGNFGPGGAVCGPTLTCAGAAPKQSGKCARFCCTDADCGSGKCNGFGTYAENGAPNLGVCSVDACDAPAVAPSQGTCFPGP